MAVARSWFSAWWYAAGGVVLFLLQDDLCGVDAFSVSQLNARCRRKQQSLSYLRGDEQADTGEVVVVAMTPSLISTLELVVDTDYWSQEWHDSFLRNGLADFVPPLTSQLSCLVVGDDLLYQAKTTQRLQYFRRPDYQGDNPLWDASLKDQELHAETFSKIVRQHLSQQQQSTTMTCGTNLAAATYDCIFDRGLLQAALDMSAEEGAKQATILLQDASRHLREQTPPLSDRVKEFLVMVGKEVGLEWNFGLDGLSEEGREVAVARKYFTAALPSFGKLASSPRP